MLMSVPDSGLNGQSRILVVARVNPFTPVVMALFGILEDLSGG